MHLFGAAPKKNKKQVNRGKLVGFDSSSNVSASRCARACLWNHERRWQCVAACPFTSTAVPLAQSASKPLTGSCHSSSSRLNTHSSLQLAAALTNQRRAPPPRPPPSSVLLLLARPQRVQPLARAADLFHMNSARQRRRLRAEPAPP